MEAAIRKRAQAVRDLGEYIGLLEWLAWSASQCVRLEMLFGSHVLAFARIHCAMVGFGVCLAVPRGCSEADWPRRVRARLDRGRALRQPLRHQQVCLGPGFELPACGCRAQEREEGSHAGRVVVLTNGRHGQLRHRRHGAPLGLGAVPFDVEGHT